MQNSTQNDLENRWKNKDFADFEQILKFVERVFFSAHFHTDLNPESVDFHNQGIKSLQKIANDFPTFVLGESDNLPGSNVQIPILDLRYYNDLIINCMFPPGKFQQNREAIRRYLPFINCEHACFARYNFSNSYFYNSNFTFSKLGLTIFNDSYLEKVDFSNVTAHKTSFQNIKGKALIFSADEIYKNANCEYSDFTDSVIEKSYFIGTNLKNTIFRKSDLTGSDIRKSKLQNADFRGAILTGITWHDSLQMIWNKVGKHTIGFNFLILPSFVYKNTPGISNTKISTAEFANSEHLEKFIKDEQFIQEYYLDAQQYQIMKYIVKIWGITSDYGRSLFRWFTLSFFLMIAFGLVYDDFLCPIWLYDPLANFLSTLDPKIEINSVDTWLSPYYFSIVTFTTLGFGDVIPKNLAAQLWIVVEVIIGYIMLGGLISLFANKLARRAS